MLAVIREVMFDGFTYGPCVNVMFEKRECFPSLHNMTTVSAPLLQVERQTRAPVQTHRSHDVSGLFRVLLFSCNHLVCLRPLDPISNELLQQGQE